MRLILPNPLFCVLLEGKKSNTDLEQQKGEEMTELLYSDEILLWNKYRGMYTVALSSGKDSLIWLPCLSEKSFIMHLKCTR